MVEAMMTNDDNSYVHTAAHRRHLSCPASSSAAVAAGAPPASSDDANENSKPPPATSASTTSLMKGLRAELKKQDRVGPMRLNSATASSANRSLSSSHSEECPCRTCRMSSMNSAAAEELQQVAESKQPSLRIVDNAIVHPAASQCPVKDETDDDDDGDETKEESLRSINGITDELIRTKLELAALKDKSSRVMNVAHQKEAVLTRRVETLGRAKEKFRKIARRLSNVPELASERSVGVGEGPRRSRSETGGTTSYCSPPVVIERSGRPRSNSGSGTDRNSSNRVLMTTTMPSMLLSEPFRLLGGLSEEKCDVRTALCGAAASQPIGGGGGPNKDSSRTIDPDELLWSHASMEFVPTGSLRGVVAAPNGIGTDADPTGPGNCLRTSLTRGISSKRLRDHLGSPAAVRGRDRNTAVVAAVIAEQAMTEVQKDLALRAARSASLHRRRGSTFW